MTLCILVVFTESRHAGFLSLAGTQGDPYCREAYAEAEQCQYSHELHLARAAHSKNNSMAPRELRLHGLSPFLQQLAHTDATSLWVVPIAYAGLFGVVKNFWDALLARSLGEHLQACK